MIVLGLHGWEGTHDAAAALIVDGRLMACVEEERLNRRKHALSDRPRLAARAVLTHAGIRWEDIDVVSYAWNLPVYSRTHWKRWDFADDREFLSSALDIRPRRWPRLEWIDHHHAHAAGAFCASGFDRAAVIVVDGQGEGKSISVYTADSTGIRLVRDWLPSCSLGFLYEAATLYCGFRFLDAGKTMGLAAYGRRPENPLPIAWENDDILSPVPRNLEEDEVTNFWSGLISERFGSPARSDQVRASHGDSCERYDDEPSDHCPDVAAAAQEAVERVLGSLVQYVQRITGCTKVVVAGGVALNCVANGLISQRCPDYFVPPYAHDAGAAVGAAVVPALRAGQAISGAGAANLGLQYSNAEIEAALRSRGFRARRTEDPAAAAVRLLLDGQVVGWFQGRGEVGPRALGCRSILALPAPATNCQRVNRIKGREKWRPLAPSALESETPWMFGHRLVSPYMLLSRPLTSAAQERIPAVVHVDGSTRIQTVPSDSTEHYARLLRQVREETGSSVVLNTSFNSATEPIVYSPEDCVRTFGRMKLDSLVIGSFVLERR